jgi:hypothetical protein
LSEAKIALKLSKGIRSKRKKLDSGFFKKTNNINSEVVQNTKQYKYEGIECRTIVGKDETKYWPTRIIKDAG